MGSTTTQTTIANRALQLLGYKPIGSIQDNDRGARAMNRAYTPVMLSELRSNFWAFSMKRIILPAMVDAPLFGKANYFQLPGDFVMLGPPDQKPNFTFGGLSVSPSSSTPNTGQQYSDWAIENAGGVLAIASDDPAPLYVRYVSSAVTEALFDYSFAEALSAMLAAETCEELTQSNTKLQNIEKIYDAAIKAAKKRNAFEKLPVQPPIDSWILSRM